MRCEVARPVRNISVHRSLSRALRVIYCCAAAQPRAAISASCQNRNVLLSDESSGFHWDLERFPHPILFCCGVQALPWRPCFPRKRWGGTRFSSCQLYSLINLEQTANEWYGAFSLSLELNRQHSQPFLASSVAEQCWQLSRSLPHVVLNVNCIKAEREPGQPKVASCIYFARLVVLTYKQHRSTMCFKKIFPWFFFPSDAKEGRERLHFPPSFCFKLFPFSFNSEWSVLRWHWVEHGWGWTRWPLEVSNLTLWVSTIVLLFWIPPDSKLPARKNPTV